VAEAHQIIGALPAPVRARILLFEQSRIALNYEYALVVYTKARLLDLERHLIALARLRRTGNPAASKWI